MKILIIDTQELRAKVVAEAMFNHVKAEAFNLTPEVFIQAIHFYKFNDGFWVRHEQLPPESSIDIRIRHHSDGVSGYHAQLCVVYAGAKDGCVNQNTPNYGYEYGIPFPITSDNVNTAFTDHHANALIRYITHGVFPAFLRGRFFDAVLEEKLTLPLQFNTLFFEGLFSRIQEKTVKTLVIGPEMPQESNFWIKLDPALPNTSKDEIKNGQRVVSFGEGSKTLVKIQPTYLCKDEDFNKAAGKGFDQYDLAILPAELQWTPEHKRTDYWGVAEAGSLRRCGFRGLIILVSTAPARLISLMKAEKTGYFDLLRTGYTYLWDTSNEKDGGISITPQETQNNASEIWTSFRDEQFEEMSGIGEKQLPRMSESYLREVKDLLTYTGKFGFLFHDFKKFVVKQDRETTVRSAITFFGDIAPLLATVHLEALKALKTEFEELTNNTAIPEPKLFDFIVQHRNKMESWIPKPDEERVDPKALEVKPFGVLILEDDKDTSIQICKLLEDNQILCWAVNKVEDAIAKLHEDKTGELHHPYFGKKGAPSNFLRIALVDIRLESGTGRWHLKQGYDFIDQVQSSIDNYVSCVAFTQKERGMMRHSSAMPWFPKSVLRDENLSKLLVSKILELAEKNFESRLPNTTLWINGYPAVHDHPYSIYLKRHRMDPQYKTCEETINSICDTMLEYWCLLDKCNDEDIEKIKGLHLELERNYLKNSIGVGIRNNKEMKEQRSLFVGKLMARRAALTIAAYEIKRLDSIYKEDNYDALLADICYFLAHLKPHMGINSGSIKDRENGLLEYLNKNVFIWHQGKKEKNTSGFLMPHIAAFFDGIRKKGRIITCRDQLGNQQDILNKYLGLKSKINEWMGRDAMIEEEYKWLEDKCLL